MFPFYYGWFSDFKTVFVFLLAKKIPVVVRFESYIGEFNIKRTYKIFLSLKKTLSDGHGANLRPLCNSNMAEVSIVNVKWSQKNLNKCYPLVMQV